MRTHPWTTDRLRLASVEITRHCNNHCPSCDQPRSERDMSLSRFTAILDALGAMDMEAVALGGGEPTLHPALPAFLEAARGRGLQTGLTTNTRAPAREARRLEKAVEDQEAFLQELYAFRSELRRLADWGYDPDLNDGVIVNIAALHRLVPWKEAEKM
jgi:organic radical activating enzyme